MKKTILLFSVSVLFLNRFFFFIDEYKRLSNERVTDLYLETVCDTIDFKKVGRHGQICSDLQQRLSSTIFLQVVQSVVNDTLGVYKHVTLKGAVTFFVFISIIIMLSNFQKRLFKDDDHLPMIKTKIS